MKISFLIAVSIILFCAGLTVYCIMNNIIILKNFSILRTEHAIAQSFREQKKNITLFFFKNNYLKQENETITVTDNNQENCMVLINRWLSLLADESIVSFRIQLQSASYDVTEKKLIISFEQSFLNNTDPIFKKLMTIETLLKTIRENLPHIQEVCILVNHQPLQDPHIDTTHAWPVCGFTQIQ